nr:MAG TPA: adenine-specific methyltransferase [Caudoviricetes sp.]
MSSKNLNNAKFAKKDEFYTQLSDIEKELCHYTEHFKGKVVYCNCDDPRESNFVRYFVDRFHELGLKKLIATCYKDQSFDIFSDTQKETPVLLEYSGDVGGGYSKYLIDSLIKPIEGDGDFRSPEVKEFLDEADIVVTNPPFSLFRHFVSLMCQNGKDFIVLGNVNAISFKDVFPLVKEGSLRIGVSIHSGDREFEVPEGYPADASKFRVDEEGNLFVRVKGVRWFTTLKTDEVLPPIELTETYSEEKYPKCDNHEAINVNEVKKIPKDYDGLMAVPITFMDKYNEEQFEIIGMNAIKEGDVFSNERLICNGEVLYARIILRKRK